MPFQPLSNFEIQKYCQNEPRFDGVFSKNNLPKIKDGAYIKNLDEYKSNRTYWIALYVNDDNVEASYDTTYLITLELSKFQKSLKNFRQQKYYNKYL